MSHTKQMPPNGIILTAAGGVVVLMVSVLIQLLRPHGSSLSMFVGAVVSTLPLAAVYCRSHGWRIPLWYLLALPAIITWGMYLANVDSAATVGMWYVFEIATDVLLGLVIGGTVAWSLSKM